MDPKFIDKDQAFTLHPLLLLPESRPRLRIGFLSPPGLFFRVTPTELSSAQTVPTLTSTRRHV
jgi:hypothetical protein